MFFQACHTGRNQTKLVSGTDRQSSFKRNFLAFYQPYTDFKLAIASWLFGNISLSVRSTGDISGTWARTFLQINAFRSERIAGMVHSTAGVYLLPSEFKHPHLLGNKTCTHSARRHSKAPTSDALRPTLPKPLERLSRLTGAGGPEGGGKFSNSSHRAAGSGRGSPRERQIRQTRYGRRPRVRGGPEPAPDAADPRSARPLGVAHLAGCWRTPLGCRCRCMPSRSAGVL